MRKEGEAEAEREGAKECYVASKGTHVMRKEREREGKREGEGEGE